MPTRPAPPEYNNSVLLIAEISGYDHFSSMKNMRLIHSREIVSELLEAVFLSVELPVKFGIIDGDTIILCTEVEENRDIVVNDVALQSMKLLEVFADEQADLIDQADGGCPCRACRNIDNLKLSTLIYAGQNLLQTIFGRLEMAGSDVIQIHRLHKIAEDNAVPENAVGPLAMAPYLGLAFNTDQMTESGPVQAIICSSVLREQLHAKSRPLTRISGIREAIRLFQAHRKRKKTLA